MGLNETQGVSAVVNAIAQAIDGAPQKSAAWRTVTLQDGRVVELREPKGRDLKNGAIAVKNTDNPTVLMMGVIGQIATIGGRRLIVEQIEDLPLLDVLELVAAVTGGNPAAPSSDSTTSSDSAG